MATTDVAMKPASGNDRREGTIVVQALPTGVTSVNTDTNSTHTTTVEAMETKLTDRFDDPTYYTA